jgi:Stress responsive A/B Barrel Domain
MVSSPEEKMIKHIVMWKLKEVAECGDRIQNARKMKHDLEALKSKIPEIKHIEVGLNSLPSDGSYDVVLYSEFENEKDLETYQKHPEHLTVAEFIGTVRERRAVVDYTTG